VRLQVFNRWIHGVGCSSKRYQSPFLY
jgi:hypothetical protein